MSLINFDKYEKDLPKFKEAFDRAVPFPHLIIDNFLEQGAYSEIVKAIPQPEQRHRSSDYIFAKNKFENPQFERSSDVLSKLRNEMLSDRFCQFLNGIYPRKIFLDPHFTGGGIHQGGEGSFLDMHADFTRHPLESSWLRELNVLFYLNDNYREDWGGHLELENAHNGETGKISPIGNRLVIMLTKEHTLHGYKQISFPTGLMRTSIAAYAYSVDLDFQSAPDRSTLWKPRSGGILKQLLSKVTPSLVSFKRQFLGSSTAKRANRQ